MGDQTEDGAEDGDGVHHELELTDDALARVRQPARDPGVCRRHRGARFRDVALDGAVTVWDKKRWRCENARLLGGR